ncbi:MAG: RNA-binding protein [Thermoproteota archaeon]|nr:RNA-binding protein [Thermoproteota archaeon]
MNRLGRVLHLSNNRHLVLRTKIKVKTKAAVLNDELNQVGLIFDIFGPVNYPYVSIKPTVNNPSKYVGHFLYTMSTDGDELR